MAQNINYNCINNCLRIDATIWWWSPGYSYNYLAHRNRSDFCDLRLRCPSRTPDIARFPRQQKAMLHCDLRVRWKVASDLRFRAAISEPKTPSFCGISGDLAQSTQKSLAIAIVRFWCAKYNYVNWDHYSHANFWNKKFVGHGTVFPNYLPLTPIAPVHPPHSTQPPLVAWFARIDSHGWFARIGNSSDSCESAWRAIKFGASWIALRIARATKNPPVPVAMLPFANVPVATLRNPPPFHPHKFHRAFWQELCSLNRAPP